MCTTYILREVVRAHSNMCVSSSSVAETEHINQCRTGFLTYFPGVSTLSSLHNIPPEKSETGDRYTARTNRGRDAMNPAGNESTPRRVGRNWKISSPFLLLLLQILLLPFSNKFLYSSSYRMVLANSAPFIAQPCSIWMEYFHFFGFFFVSGNDYQSRDPRTEQATHLDNDRFQMMIPVDRRRTGSFIWKAK